MSFWIMLYCLLSYTIGAFIPVYFTSSDIKCSYYTVTFFLLISSLSFQIAKYIARQGKVNLYWSIPGSILIIVFVFVIFGCMTLGKLMGEWTSAAVFYTNRTNPEVKIISRYMDEGALGGGTSPDDYQTVVHRPITSIFKMETSIDTAIIDKKEWQKSK